MKKLFTLMFLMFSLIVVGENMNFKATMVCAKVGTETMSEWKACDIPLTVDLEQELIMIYSKVVQRYDITSMNSVKNVDNNIIIFNAFDKDGDAVILRMIIMNDKTTLLGVFYDSMQWIYAIKMLKE